MKKCRFKKQVLKDDDVHMFNFYILDGFVKHLFEKTHKKNKQKKLIKTRP